MTLTANSSSKAAEIFSGSSCGSAWKKSKMPALAIKVSSRPKRAVVRSTTRALSAQVATSPVTTST